MEQERRMERKIQKEREEEGGEFQDKEEFVTSAYPLIIFFFYHIFFVSHVISFFKNI